MNIGKRLSAAAFAAAILVGLCACGQKTAVEEADDSNTIEVNASISGEVLRFGDSADKVFSVAVDFEDTLNPIRTKSTLNQQMSGLIYDNVFELDDNFQVTSRILDDWYYSNNVWVLVPKNNILMHDGSTLTAEDIQYSVSRVFTTGSTYYMSQLGTCYVSSYGGMVFIAGDYANALMPYRLQTPVIKANSILEERPVGSGPYMYGEEEEKIIKFEDYEGSEMLPFDEIYLRQYVDLETLISEYESGLLDFVANDPTGIYNMGYGGTNEKRVYNTTNMQYIGFNSESSFFCYEQYRYAMSWIIDRQRVADNEMNGAAVPSALFIHPNSSLFDSELNDALSYNPERCREELEKLGCRDLDGDDMLEFALSGSKVEIYLDFIVCSDTASKVQAARRIAEDMMAIGLNVHLRELSWNSYRKALEDGEYDMYYAECSITADWNVLPLFQDEAALNFSGWNESSSEDLFFAFLEADDDARPQAQSAMLQDMTTRAYFLPVCFEKREVISHLGTISGTSVCQHNFFYRMQNWKVNIG